MVPARGLEPPKLPSLNRQAVPFAIKPRGDILVGGAGFEPAISCFRCRRDDLTSLPSETWSTVQALPLRSPDPVVVRRIITFPTADNSVDGAPGRTRTDTPQGNCTLNAAWLSSYTTGASTTEKLDDTTQGPYRYLMTVNQLIDHLTVMRDSGAKIGDYEVFMVPDDDTMSPVESAIMIGGELCLYSEKLF